MPALFIRRIARHLTGVIAMSNAFWEVPASAVKSSGEKDGKYRIEYDASVFPTSGMVVNGTSEWGKLPGIHFSGDQLGEAVLRVKPSYAVLADVAAPDPNNVSPELMAKRLDGSGTGLPAAVFKSERQPNGQVYMVLVNKDHPQFAESNRPAGVAPVVTTHPTPPPATGTPSVQPPGGVGAGGQLLALENLIWPATQDKWDFAMGGLDTQPFEVVVRGNKDGSIKVIEYPGGPIMRRLYIEKNGARVYGDPNEAMVTRSQVSFAELGGLKDGDRIKGLIENHGEAGGPGSCRLEILTN
jgi:hypothetical protein